MSTASYEFLSFDSAEAFASAVERLADASTTVRCACVVVDAPPARMAAVHAAAVERFDGEEVAFDHRCGFCDCDEPHTQERHDQSVSDDGRSE
jgi:hypothetical protein